MRFRRGKHLDERGAALVEAALIIPILILVTFGAIEMGFAFNEQGTIRAATRTAARAASTQAKAPWTDVGTTAVDTLNSSVANLSSGTPNFALLYNPANGNPTTIGGCSNNCAVFTWNASTKKFVAAGGEAWLPQERNACSGQTDEIAVFLSVEHRWLTGLPFTGSGSKTLTSKTVMSLEPISDTTACGTTP
jgi:Flp pilus assembly protein TadG